MLIAIVPCVGMKIVEADAQKNSIGVPIFQGGLERAVI